MEEEKFQDVCRSKVVNDERLDQFSKSFLVLSYVCTTFSMAVLPSMNTALTVAESGSEDVSIGLSYLVP